MAKKKQQRKRKRKPSVQLLLRENQKLRKQISNNAAGDEVITAVVREALKGKRINCRVAAPPRVRPPKRDSADYCVALAHVTDLQCGKVTPSYSSEICEGRMMEYAEQVHKAVHIRNRNRRINTLHLYWGGDMIEGEQIFPHQAHIIDSSVFEQACRVAPTILTRMVLYWLQSFQHIKIFAVRGNHGRPTSKSAGSNPKTNWDSVCYEVARLMIEKAMIEQRINSRRIEFNISDTFYAIDECLGHKHLLIHGDTGIRGFAGFPWYGVGRKMWGWIDSIKEEWNHMYFGHFHQMAQADVNGRRWYCGGTPESDNEYARAELAASGRPQQRLQILNCEQVVCDLPIYLNYGLES